MRQFALLTAAAAAVIVAGNIDAASSRDASQMLVELELNVTSSLIQAYQQRLAVLQHLQEHMKAGNEYGQLLRSRRTFCHFLVFSQGPLEYY